MKYDYGRQLVIDRLVCILRWVMILLVVATTLFGRQNKLLVIGNLLLSGSMLFLWVSQRQYIHEGKESPFSWQDYSANETDMLLCTMIPPLVLGIRAFTDYAILDWTMLIIVVAVASAALGAVLLWAIKPEKTKTGLKICIFVVLVLCMVGVCLQLNFVLDFSEPEVQRCKVLTHRMEEISSNNPKVPDSVSYTCVVVTDVGEELEIGVSREQYLLIRKGSTVAVMFSHGALGIRYAYIPQY